MKLLVCVLALFACQAFAASQACSDSSLDGVWHAQAQPKWSVQSEEAEFQKFRLQTLVSELATPTVEQTGRGVVIVVSQAQQNLAGFVAASKIRSLSSLPIEVIHAGAVDEVAAKEFTSLANVAIKQIADSMTLFSDAVLSSSFNEVIAYDAQTVALADPASLFEVEQYKAKGLLMFPTLHKTASTNPIWSVLDRACVDSFEQSVAAIVVNKATSFKALSLASKLRNEFFRSLTDGQTNVVRVAAMATGTDFHMSESPRMISSNYNVNSERQSCAHLAVYSISGVDMFSVSSNAVIETSGAQLRSVNCINTASAVNDDALVNAHVELFSTAPATLYKFKTMACSGTYYNEAQVRAAINGAGLFATLGLDFSTATPPSTYTVNIPYSYLIKNLCSGSQFPILAATSYSNNDLDVGFFNITTGSTKSAHVEIWTPSSYNGAAYNGGFGNSTVLYVTNFAGRTEADYPAPGYYDTSVSYNLATGTSAAVMVAFMPSQKSEMRAITVIVRYTGESNNAITTSYSPMLLGVAAIVAIVANRVFGF